MQHINEGLAQNYSVPFKKTENVTSVGFHQYPEYAGWRLENNILSPKPGRLRSMTMEFEELLGSWLFFGLLHAVMGLDEQRLNGYIDGGCLNTKHLADDLVKWERQEAEKRESLPMRMIRAGAALDTARKVVLTYCSVAGKTASGALKIQMHKVSPELSLTLMVLGETLSSAKAKLVQRLGCHINGWQSDASEGWGTPGLVLDSMQNQKWCAKTQAVLRTQFRSHATSLVTAYYFNSKNENAHLIEGHGRCTEDHCCKKSEDLQQNPGKYATAHHRKCANHATCARQERIGPKMQDVANIIKAGGIPLFNLTRSQDDYYEGPVQVKQHVLYDEYITISHVWADGYGNEEKNELYACQLRFFSKLYKDLRDKYGKDQPDLPFWIDTFALPVENRWKNQRLEAIKQIHQVYTGAKCTIVVDNGLNGLIKEGGYEVTAMKILASGWMRRLWTLQEAYLSKKLLFQFKNGLVCLDELESGYGAACHRLSAVVPTFARQYFHNLMGPTRNTRMAGLNPTYEGFGLVASAWRAAQWRTTSHLEHEALALATLLELNYQNTKFADAGEMPAAKGTTVTRYGKNRVREKTPDEKLADMMRDLWILLEEFHPGSIPPGIIFLPGRKLTEQGFGWAPRTWMQCMEIDYPDPISVMSYPTKLTHSKGLQVQYPGYRLHTRNNNKLLEQLTNGGFIFPTDSTLLRWYQIRAADDEPEQYLLEETKNASAKLAVIISRPWPRDIPEIGLLVEMKDPQMVTLHDQRKHVAVFPVSMLMRVRVEQHLEAKSNFTKDRSPWNPEDPDTIVGEILDNDQRWIVDGEQSSTIKKTPPASSKSRNQNYVSKGPIKVPVRLQNGPKYWPQIRVSQMFRSKQPLNQELKPLSQNGILSVAS